MIVWAMLLSTIALAAPRTTQAAGSCTWNGTSGSWSDITKWSCGQVPTSSDAVTIGFNKTITLDVAAAAQSLNVSYGTTISGQFPIAVVGATTVTADTIPTTISTLGSSFPQLNLSANNTLATITDPQLSATSLLTLTTTTGGNGGVVLDTSAHNVGALNVAGGLNFTGPLTVTNSMTLAGSLGAAGSGSTPASLTVASSATLTILGGTLTGVALTNAGSATLNATNFLFQTSGSRKASFTNSGTLVTAPTSDANINGTGSIINSGTWRKQGASTLAVYLSFTNRGTLLAEGGTLRFFDDITQHTGELRLVGGTVQGNNEFASLSLTGGALTGAGRLQIGVNNSGGVFAPTGLITIAGLYTQGITGTLAITVSGLLRGTDFGAVDIERVANRNGEGRFNGQIQLNRGGSFRPVSGDRLPVFSCTAGCSGTFSGSSGNLTPAFGGFAATTELFVSEPEAALALRIGPSVRSVAHGAEFTYTVAAYNPTNTAITVSNLRTTLPISLTYRTGTTSGAITTEPSDFATGTTRTLIWAPTFSVPPGETRTVIFGVRVDANTPAGVKTIDLSASAGGRAIAYSGIGAVNVNLGAAGNTSIAGGAVNVSTMPPTLFVGRSGLNNRSFQLRARIRCPFPACGTLSTVYIRHGSQIYLMQRDPNQTVSTQANDYGFWKGQIPGTGVIPGVPFDLFPDWDDHRPCIAYDYGGGGGRPLGCVDGGDSIGIPQLYDPSGIITNARTGQPVVGATVALYRVPLALPDTRTATRQCRTLDTRGGSTWSGAAADTGIFEIPGLEPPQISPNINPQITGTDGRYGWNVVTGCWYVKVSAPGYVSRISALVGVPPEVTDLDMTLEPGNTPAARRSLFLAWVRR